MNTDERTGAVRAEDVLLAFMKDRALTPAERRRTQQCGSKAKGYAAQPGTGPADETCGSYSHLVYIHEIFDLFLDALADGADPLARTAYRVRGVGQAFLVLTMAGMHLAFAALGRRSEASPHSDKMGQQGLIENEKDHPARSSNG